MNIDFKLDKNSNIPLYIQLYENLKMAIDKFPDGEKLPSIRSLSKALEVNNVTVINAYKMLEQEGLVYTVEGSGTYVRKPLKNYASLDLEEGDFELMLSGIFPHSKPNIDFASVTPSPDLFPIRDFKESLIEILDRDGGNAFSYPEIRGYEPLRESISKFLSDNYLINVSEDGILITSGGQQGLDIVSKTLIEPLDVVFVENPTYPGAYQAFKSRGAKIIGIPIEKDGINIEILKSYLKRYSPKFIYTMPNFQNPTTVCYSEEKKRELLRLAIEHDFYIVEDDFLTDLTFNNSTLYPIKSYDRSDKVIFIKSFSKIFMPGIRVGFLTVPEEIFKDVYKAKHSTDISSSGYLQRAFDLYLRKGYWKNYIENIKESYKKKYDLFTNELDKLTYLGVSYAKPYGGLSIWVNLDENISQTKVYEDCLKLGLATVPGNVFSIDINSNINALRLSFSAPKLEEIPLGFSILKNVLNNIKNGDKKTYMPFV
ncbi:MAG: PLP-dependent aminotransferase family protein [Tissierellales bacterium]|nr:PLP-dependent aminotransferase family protein [Tissierellales bacterium]